MLKRILILVFLLVMVVTTGAQTNRGGAATGVRSGGTLPPGAHINSLFLKTGTSAGLYQCTASPCTSAGQWKLLASITQPVVISTTFNGTFQASTVLIRFPATYAYTIPQDCTNSVAVLNVAATGSTVFSLRKNDVEFGTVTFGVGGTSGTFSCVAPAVFAKNDILTIVAPSSPDSTAASIGLSLSATR